MPNKKRKSRKRRPGDRRPLFRDPPAQRPDANEKAGDVQLHRAVALWQRQKRSEARDICIEILRKDPASNDAWNLLGMLLYELGERSDAVSAMRQSLRLQPRQPQTLSNLGVLLGEMGDPSSAIDLLQQAIELQPKSAQPHNNLANIYRQQARYELAENHYRAAIESDPDYVEAHSNLGALLVDTQEFERAESHLRRAIELQPSHASSWINLGALLNQQHRTDEAVEVCRRTCELTDAPEAATNLGLALLAKGETNDAQDQLERAATADLRLAGNHLFTLGQNTSYTDEEVAHHHRTWGQKVEAEITPFSHAPPETNESSRPLRVGYVSPDFRDHVIARYLLPVLQCHYRNRFELFAYAEVDQPDHATALLEQHFDHWRSTYGVADRVVAEQIRNDKIDVLIDLAGHTRGNRLRVFAYRPAVVQATWLGYPNTTGLGRIDYCLTNAFLNPDATASRYSEELMHLPHGSACYLAPGSPLQPNRSPVLDNGFLTFGSLNRPNKVTDDTLDLWAGVLQSIPDSKLIMYFPTLHGEVAAKFHGALRQRSIAEQRVEIRSQASEAGYLEQYHEIDVALDVTPWTGGTTIRDACWMGVTPLTLCGERRSARASSDVLRQLDLHEFITHSTDEYVALAKQVARKPERVVELRHELRLRVEQKLCDSQQFTADLEHALLTMYDRVTQGKV